MDGPWLHALSRLGGALLVGAAVGWDRERRERPAGLRTHMLVSLGAALMVMIPLELELADPTRVVQGVSTGIGFLCAGDILRRVRDGQEIVKGLTSAAALWVTAALGMVVAGGLWPLAVVGTVGTVVVLTLLKQLETPRPGHDGAPPKP
jgi:putative Mg2+ transporter-C (MgtC) family protein